MTLFVTGELLSSILTIDEMRRVTHLSCSSFFFFVFFAFRYTESDVTRGGSFFTLLVPFILVCTIDNPFLNCLPLSREPPKSQ